MRLLHLIPTLEGGGAERQLVLLANAQSRRGTEVHIGLVRAGAHAGNVSPQVQIHRADVRSHYDSRLLVWAIGLLRRLKPDLVQTWLPLMDVVGGMAALAVGTPWVLGERSSAPMYMARWQDRIVRRGMGRFASAVVANSESGLEYWSVGGSRSQVRAVIRNALDLEEIQGARQHIEWPAPGADHPRILFAGRLSPAKDVFTFIRALHRLSATSKFSGLVLGLGPDLVEAQRLVRETGLEGMISFGGYRDDLWSVMKAARVFVSTSRVEGHPNTVLEALACGTPVIVSDIPQHREFLDERSVRFAAPGDDAAFSNALIAMLSEPEPESQARFAAGREVVALLGTDATVSGYDAVYQAVRSNS